MDKLSVGIIGLGGAGRAHATRFRKNKFVGEIIGYDHKHIELQGIRVCSGIDELLAAVDVVSICTPDSTHYDYIIKCMIHGKHVLVEKPMVSSYEEALALKDFLLKHPTLKFAIHHQMRYVPAFQEAKQLINRGDLGTIFYMEANYWHDMRARNTLFDDWRIKGKGQSVIFGSACHPLDLLLYLSGGEAKSHKTALNKNGYPDYPGAYTSATTILQFTDNVVAKCHSNNCVAFPQMNNLIILGDEGTYIDGVLYKNENFKAVRHFGRNSQDQILFNKLALIQPWSAFLKILTKQRLFRTNPFSVYDHEYACMVIVDNFIDAVIKDEPVLVGYDDGRRVIQLCHETEADGLANFMALDLVEN